MTSSVARKLASVQWDFTDAKTKSGPHTIHPYPAKFIPQIPRNLIEIFHPADDSLVLDPFCGSGTTLVEAMSLGISAVGIDVHPLAVLISKVKTTPLPKDILPIAKEILQSAQERMATQRLVVPAIPRLDHWFQKDIQIALAALITEIEQFPDPAISNALKVAFSSIIVRVSNQESDTRYAAITKNVSPSAVWLLFEKAVMTIQTALYNQEQSLFPRTTKADVINEDLMTIKHEKIGQRVGLVVTSPPYPNAYEYWLYHKYRMYWLGMNPLAVKEREIGARAHYFKKNHQTELDFEKQMGTCFRLLSQVMKPGAFACFVIGRSIIHGRHIDNELLLERAARPHGFQKASVVGRKIAAHRKSFNLSHANIKEEGILIFQAGGQL